MRACALVLVCSVAVIVLTTASSTAAYVDVGLDPAGDGAGEVPIVDVVRTERAVWRDDDGHRWFRVAFRAVEPLRGTAVDVEVRIDARGDEHADSLISFSNLDRKLCYMGKSVAPRNQLGRVRMRGRDASCRVPLRWLDPGGKRIRWRILSQTREGGPTYHRDEAPDTGWYR